MNSDYPFNQMDKSRKHNVEWEKQETNTYIMVPFKNSQN